MTRVYGQCPMGCGATLFLGEGGHVTCSWHKCPEPGAADELLSRAAGVRSAAAVLVEHLEDAWWTQAAEHLGVLRSWVREPAHLNVNVDAVEAVRNRTPAETETLR